MITKQELAVMIKNVSVETQKRIAPLVQRAIEESTGHPLRPFDLTETALQINADLMAEVIEQYVTSKIGDEISILRQELINLRNIVSTLPTS
jgi:hypothetical protein